MPKLTVPIYDGDDFERLADLRRAIQTAERRLDFAKREEAEESARAGDDGGVSVARARGELERAHQAFDEFVTEAADRAEPWVVQSIGHEEFRQLLKDHPPRTETLEDGTEKVDPIDDLYGVNVETFPKALLTYVDPDDDEFRTIAEPAFESVAAMRKRVKRLSSGEFDTLWATAFKINTAGASDPKFETYSTGTSTLDET